MGKRVEPGSSILLFLVALSLLGTSCQSGGMRAGPGPDVVPVCAPGYRPTGPGGECVDITGTPQGQTPPPVVQPPAPESEDWLGDYTGTCGEAECRVSLTEETGEGLVAVLSLPGRDPLRMPGVRITGSRARGVAEEAGRRTVLDLQLRDGALYGIWTIRDSEDEILEEIRFVVRRVAPGG